MKSYTRWIGRALFVAAVLVWAVVLRPQTLGGPAAYVVVRGDSMLPTYQTGDMLLAYGKPSYSVGDIVAYRVAAGEVGAGHVVVHRIIAIDADDTFVIQGDNNPTYDPWKVKPSDVVGSVVFRAPGVGNWLQVVLSPTIAGGFAAAVIVMLLVARMPQSGGPVPQPSPRTGVARRFRPARADS